MVKNLNDFISVSSKVHNYKYSYNKSEYINTHTKIIIVCPHHGEFLQIPKNHIKGHGCSKCAIEYKSNKLSKDISILVNEFKVVHDDFYDYSKVNYINNKTKIDIICPNHGDFQITPSHHLNGHGCSKCVGSYHRTVQELKNDLNNIHNNRYEYPFSSYRNIKDRINIICSDHGEFNQTIGHHLNGHGCPSCYISNGEKEIEEYLITNKINYTREKTFNGCVSEKGNRLRFDFFLIDQEILIEYDGVQHFKPVDYFGGVSGFKKRVKHDEIKNEFAKYKNIKLLRISYNQNINKKLKDNGIG